MAGLREPRRKTSVSVWRWIEVVALVATIPAFYLAMLSAHRGISVALYLVAFVASAWVAWKETPGARRAGSLAARTRQRGWEWALAAALLLSATLPDGDDTAVLVVRLVTAGLIVARLGDSFRPWFSRGGLPYLLALALAVFGLCGMGFWGLEPRVHTFGDGLWLAFTTAATVGYGDIVPSTPAAKIFAVFVVLMGLAVLSLVTASIAAMWVQTEERRIEHEILRDLHAQLRAVRDDMAALRRDADLARSAPRRAAGDTDG